MSTENRLDLQSQCALTRSSRERIEIVRFIISEIRTHRIDWLNRKPPQRRQDSHSQWVSPVTFTLQGFHPFPSIDGSVQAPSRGVKSSNHFLVK